MKRECLRLRTCEWEVMDEIEKSKRHSGSPDLRRAWKRQPCRLELDGIWQRSQSQKHGGSHNDSLAPLSEQEACTHDPTLPGDELSDKPGRDFLPARAGGVSANPQLTMSRLLPYEPASCRHPGPVVATSNTSSTCRKRQVEAWPALPGDTAKMTSSEKHLRRVPRYD